MWDKMRVGRLGETLVCEEHVMEFGLSAKRMGSYCKVLCIRFVLGRDHTLAECARETRRGWSVSVTDIILNNR